MNIEKASYKLELEVWCWR